MTDKTNTTGIKPPPPKPKNLGLGAPALKPAPVTAHSDSELTPLSFKVDPEFKRALRMYAAKHDLSMVEVMKAAVNEYMGRNG